MYQVGHFVYFFFREVSVESTNCGSRTVSRIGRVCSNDVGGDSFRLNGQWTTFNKATLNCSFDGVSYDHLQSVDYDEQLQKFFAVFTASQSALPASAVCVFQEEEIRAAFSGGYLVQTGSESAWLEHPNSHPYFDCEVEDVTSRYPGKTKKSLAEAQRYQLMARRVQSASFRPLQVAPLERYLHIAVDQVRVKHFGLIPVVFILTEEGILKKLSILNDDFSQQSPCLVEVLQVFSPTQTFQITQLKLNHDLNLLYIGGYDMLLKLPMERCERFKTRQECIDAKDPYCGWNSRIQKCSLPPGGIISHHYWHQNLNGCPKMNLPVNGGFGDWSAWFSCPRSGEFGENCRCRSRQCDTPKPLRGGAECQDPTVQVSNCTQHGMWTEWSDWSACSTSCGVAVRTRKRYCSNPAPAFGGRACLGPDSQQEYCKQTACPVLRETPIHGGWSDWSSWDICSRKCGSGIQRRIRFCNNPTPANNGSNCAGCDLEYRVCNNEPCEEVRRWTDWTPWLVRSNRSSDSEGVWVQRFKYACRARIDDPKLLSVSRPRKEEKLCRKNGQDCTDTAFEAVDGGWADWTDWSECSQPCGNGSQSRYRPCSNPSPSGSGADCSGHAKEQRQCNSHNCQAEWSCWSPYSDCSVSCGGGVKQRVRKCPRQPGMKLCQGERIETISCDMGACQTDDGYGDWSAWSACSGLGVKVRIRPCFSRSFCDGKPDAQMKKCFPGKTNAVNALEYRSEASSGNLVLILGMAGAFAAGVAVSLILACVALRRGSHCCFAFGKKKSGAPTLAQMPPIPSAAKSNIYTPPPIRNNIHPTPHITLNPLLGPEKASDFDDAGLTEQEASLTLRRTMRASLNPKDYL